MSGTSSRRETRTRVYDDGVYHDKCAIQCSDALNGGCGELKRNMNTKTKGDLSVAKILTEMLRLEKSVSLPWEDNQPYDLIMDSGTSLYKIQCKTGRLRKGVIKFNTCSNYLSSKGVITYSYKGKIDFWAVYCIELDKSYLIPYADVPDGGIGNIRVDPTMYRNQHTQKFAKEYEIDIIIGGLS